MAAVHTTIVKTANGKFMLTSENVANIKAVAANFNALQVGSGAVPDSIETFVLPDPNDPALRVEVVWLT